MEARNINLGPRRGLVDGDIVATVAAAITEPTWWHVLFDDKELGEFRYKAEAVEHVETTIPKDKIDRVSYVPEKRLEPVEHALQVCKTMLWGIREETGIQKLDVYVTADSALDLAVKTNFRYSIAKTKPYKGHRTGEKPAHTQACYDYLIEKWGAHVVYGMEADDALAMEHWKCWTTLHEEDGSISDYDLTAICSTDKDLKQVPGYNYNFTNKVLTYITQKEADAFLAKQWLMGDSTDNIPGCRSVGDKRADALLARAKTWEDMVETIKQTYLDKGHTEAECLEQFKLVFMLRDGEDYENIVSQIEGPDSAEVGC